MKQKNQKFKTALSSAKIEIKILKSLKLASLKQQEFFNEFYFQFFNAYETDVRKNNRFFLRFSHKKILKF